MKFPGSIAKVRPLSLRDNGYDVIRLILAASVVYSHSYAVGGFGLEPTKPFSKEGVILGELGVLGFFGLSGFLVSASFERSRSVGSYLLKRARRIFPGYWVCLALTAFLFAPLIWCIGRGESLGAFPWTGTDGALDFLMRNFFLQIRQGTVGTVLQGAAWPGSINGSLWSLFPEFLCYIGVALLGVGGAFSGSRWLLAAAALTAFAYHVVVTVRGPEAFPDAPSLFALTIFAPYLTAFVFGACASVWKDLLHFSWVTVLVLAFLTIWLIRLGGFEIASPILITALVLSAGGCFSAKMNIDLSYGIYIYSFPCQQLLFAAGWASAGLPLFFAASLLASAAFAWLSWTLVEKPSLHRNSSSG